MKEIIKNSDLGIPYTNTFNKSLVKTLKKLLGINKLNLLYDSVYEYKGVECAQEALKKLDISVSINGDVEESIPESGAFIAIANHPHGALDGLLLADVVVGKRADTKFMGNFLLEKVEPMKEMFLSVNPFNAKAARNIPGIRAALNHLRAGHGLIIFPAGEVSTYHKGLKFCEDKEWEDAVMKFIRTAKVPVVPIHISGKNSRKFHFVGKIHPALRTIRLPLELVNKQGAHIDIALGFPISVIRQTQLKALNQYKDYLRANVYYMTGREEKEEQTPNANTHKEPISAAVDSKILAAEIGSIESECKLLRSGDYEVYCAPTAKIPNVLEEICRLRELTFRLVGEGTNKCTDRDEYDEYYHHLFIWDTTNNQIIGAYRVGFGAAIMNEFGIEGFYTHSLFEYSSKFTDTLSQSIELGRSFIIQECQRQVKPLLVLWQGILTILLRNDDYKYLLGPVSMSGAYSANSKAVVINYLKTYHWDSKLSKMVVPRNGIQSLAKSRIDGRLLRNIEDVGLIDKLLLDIDTNRMPLPILIKKYIQLGGVVLAFNVDPAFNNALDALILLDITKVPLRTIELLGKEYGMAIDYSRFTDKQ